MRYWMLLIKQKISITDEIVEEVAVEEAVMEGGDDSTQDNDKHIGEMPMQNQCQQKPQIPQVSKLTELMIPMEMI